MEKTDTTNQVMRPYKGMLMRRKHPVVNGNKFYAVTRVDVIGEAAFCVSLRRLRQKDGVGLEMATAIIRNGESVLYEPVDLDTLTSAQRAHFAGWLVAQGVV